LPIAIRLLATKALIQEEPVASRESGWKNHQIF